MALSRDDLVGCKRRLTSFEIPEMGACWIQSMTELERSEDEYYLHSKMQSSNGKPRKQTERDTYVRVRARAVQRCVVNEEGKREFSDSEEDTNAILAMDARVTELITNEIDKHCGFLMPTEAEQEATEKKSETDPDSGSPTS